MKRQSNQLLLTVGGPVAEIEITYSRKVKATDRVQIKSSRDVYRVLYETWEKDQIELREVFKIMLLDRSSRVTGIYQVSSGGVAGTLVDPKLVFMAALKAAAASIILCHNHPSGNTAPSKADIDLTRKLKEGGSLLDIAVLDHVILTAEQGKYYSFADEGLL